MQPWEAEEQIEKIGKMNDPREVRSIIFALIEYLGRQGLYDYDRRRVIGRVISAAYKRKDEIAALATSP